jgi:hypothetical protein
MGYVNTMVTLTSGSEVTDAIAVQLTGAGWAQAGTVYTRTFGGRTMTVDLIGMNWLSSTPYITVNGVTAYFPCFSLVSGTQVYALISVWPDFFYVRVAGPNPGAVGAYDATFGSPRAFACITTITPADDADSNLDAQQAVIRSHSSTSPTFATPSVVQKFGPTGTSNQPAELMCIRPAIQDIASIGDLPPSIKSGSGSFGSRYAVVDLANGLRGTLDGIAFASENYTLAGDISASQFALDSEYARNGVQYVVDAPCGAPSAAAVVSYSPLGLTTVLATNQAQYVTSPTLSGPRIFVRRS